MDTKIRDFLQRNVGFAVAILACGVYLATSFIRIDETGKTVRQIIIDSAIVFLLGFFINRSFDLQGIMLGERSEVYQNTMTLHSEAVIKVSPQLDKLDEWCAEKNAENLRMQRVRILAGEGLRYADFFSADGSLKDGSLIDLDGVQSRSMRRYYRRRNKCVEKALHIELTPLSAGELTSEGAKGDDPYNFGRTKAEYEKQMSIHDCVSKTVIALIFGYYGVELLQDFSYANLIWHAMQVAMFLLIGAAAMYHSYSFITTEHRGRIVKKVNCLEMFASQMQKEAEEATTKGTEVETNE